MSQEEECDEIQDVEVEDYYDEDMEKSVDNEDIEDGASNLAYVTDEWE